MPARSARPVRLAACLALLAVTTGAAPQPDVLDADDPTLDEGLFLAEEDLVGAIDIDEDVVLAAQKVRTTVQDAPSIITVVTREQIRERGYRTLNEVLASVAGFEGDRWEGNGWHKEAFARGLPRTVLVLVNGVNIIEPVRNYVNLDRKIPLEMVERVEVTSGPGGVLWGSNALLGIVNVVTRRPDDSGVHAVAGFGGGPGENRQFKTALGLSERFGEHVGLFAHLSLYSTDGPELTVADEKVVGAVPAPAPDAETFYLPGERTTTPGERSWFLNFSGRLEVGAFALDWMLPFERDHRALATGGSIMRRSYLTGEDTGEATRGRDEVRLVNLSYRDRFAEGDVGLKARAYFVEWNVEESPFGVFPASPILFASQGHKEDLHVEMAADLVARTGAAADLDWRLGHGVTLLTGGEAFVDINRGLTQRNFLPATGGRCPVVQVDGVGEVAFERDPFDPYLECSAEETLVADTDRVIGAGFAQVDWEALPSLALNAGLRLQASDAYEPAILYSGGLVWNVVDRTNVKLFTASGLRPPSFTATHTRNTSQGITFDANPDLDVERSQSFETEINTMILRDVGGVRDLFLRANGAYTLMTDVIKRPAGQFANAGRRRVGTAEGLLRLRFDAGHELWGNYTFTRVVDDDTGEVRNFARHMGNVGGKLSFLGGHIELDAVLNLKGEMEDPNRPPLTDSSGDYSVSCAQVRSGDLPPGVDAPSLASACRLPGLGGGVIVRPGQVVDETIRPLVLLDVGVRFKDIWRDLTASIFVYNLLDHRYFEPDFFQDPRVLSRPQPKPGLSIFGQLAIGL
ncbi:MAG: TonB-dependent receptor plug domain-containing protein [Myxococcota bacterium]